MYCDKLKYVHLEWADTMEFPDQSLSNFSDHDFSFELHEPRIKQMIGWADEANELFGEGLLGDIYPIFRYIPTPTVRRLKQIMNEANDYFTGILQEHRDTFDPGTQECVAVLFEFLLIFE